MTAILTPALALRHLRQLSTDVRAAVVLASADLAVLAREGENASVASGAVARENASVASGPVARDGAPAGTVLAASDDEHVLAVVAGPHALLPLLCHDLATLLADMREGEPAPAPAAAEEPSAAAAAPADGRAAALAEGAPSGVQVLERADSAVSAAIFAGLGILATGKP